MQWGEEQGGALRNLCSRTMVWLSTVNRRKYRDINIK